MHVEGERVSHVGQSTKMKIREYKAKNKLLGRVQPDKSVTIKSILYYNAAHVFIHPCYILLFYPIHEGRGFLQNIGTQLPDWTVSHPRRQFYCHCYVILISYTCLYSPLPFAHAQTCVPTHQALLKSDRFILCAVFGFQLPTCACIHVCKSKNTRTITQNAVGGIVKGQPLYLTALT